MVVVGLGSVESGALIGVVAFVVRDVMGLSERSGGKCGLAGEARGAVAVGGLVVSAAVCTGESLCGHGGWEVCWCCGSNIVWLRGLVGARRCGARGLVGVFDEFVVVLIVVLGARGTAVRGFGVAAALVG